MATKIQWTEETWNPTRGCSRISTGCEHCYAERQAIRFRSNGYAGLVRSTPSGPRWTGKVRLVPDKLEEPLRWRKPRLVFVDSMSDLFHERLTNEEIAEVFGVMAVAGASGSEKDSAQGEPGGCFQGAGDGFKRIGKMRIPQYRRGPHTFQVLTKRAARMRDTVASRRFRERVADAAHRHAQDRRDAGWLSQSISGRPEWGNHCTLDEFWPLPNVWLGVSVEVPSYLHRIDHLKQTPAAVRFVSLEPLLADLDGLDKYLSGVDWVIVGGESGPGARPCNVSWIRNVVYDCDMAGVPCFVKQLGSHVVDSADVEDGAEPVRQFYTHRKAGEPAEWDPFVRVRQYPETP
jgi:protein gp37